IAESDVVYIENDSVGTECTKASPCPTLNDGLAARGSRSHIKFNRGTNVVMDTAIASFAGGTQTAIVADAGAQLSRSRSGPTIEGLEDTPSLKIVDLRLTGAIGTNFSGHGVSLMNAVELELLRVIIDHNSGLGLSGPMLTGGKVTLHESIVAAN